MQICVRKYLITVVLGWVGGGWHVGVCVHVGGWGWWWCSCGVCGHVEGGVHMV